jgi:hypothetical protein
MGLDDGTATCQSIAVPWLEGKNRESVIDDSFLNELSKRHLVGNLWVTILTATSQ